MPIDPQRQRLLLGAVLGGLLLVLWWQFAPTSGAPGAGTVAARPAVPASGAGGVTPAETLAAGVGLDRLARIAPAPIESGRDPFVFGRSLASGGLDGSDPGRAGSDRTVEVPSVVAAPVMPAGPPPPPAILVKFIGIVQRGDVGTVAVLSDGKNVYYGREGEIVDGRWRIVRIGEESLQIEHADGRGRQTVRLTG